MVLGAGWPVVENRVREGLEKMIDERCGARIVYSMLKFGARCVRTLRVVDAPNQKIANVLDVVLFDCHYD